MSGILHDRTADFVALGTLVLLYLGGFGVALWRIRAAATRGKLYWIVCVALLAGGALAIAGTCRTAARCRRASRSASRRSCSDSRSSPRAARG